MDVVILELHVIIRSGCCHPEAVCYHPESMLSSRSCMLKSGVDFLSSRRCMLLLELDVVIPEMHVVVGTRCCHPVTACFHQELIWELYHRMSSGLDDIVWN